MSILSEAQQITDTGHEGQYPEWKEEAQKVADIMNSLYKDLNITADQFTMLMVILKITREAFKHKRDNLVDMVGYTALLQQLYNPGEDA